MLVTDKDDNDDDGDDDDDVDDDDDDEGVDYKVLKSDVIEN